MNCDGCKFCCWSFLVDDMPNEILGIELKHSITHCKFECSKGCSIHEEKNYPTSCKTFSCPYIDGADIHRPDVFQETLEAIGGNIGNYIPNIPSKLNKEEVEDLINETEALPVFILINNNWHEVIMPLKRNLVMNWVSTKEIAEKWEKLYKKNNADFPKESKKLVDIVMK